MMGKKAIIGPLGDKIPKKRGMIGPLGDDIPSIFPIVASVLLFTGTVLYALDLVQQKNVYLEIRRGATALSYAVTEKGFVENQTFKDACETRLKPLGEAKSVTFLITIKRFCDGIPLEKQSDPATYPKQSPYFVDESTTADETWLYCTNEKTLATPTATLFPEPKRVSVMNYPVAVPCPDTNSPTRGLGIINVIAWK